MEIEPLRRIGIDISEAAMQQELYRLGVQKSVNTLSQADKSLLRYSLVMRQTTNAQGDMGATLNTAANQMRIFNQQIEIASRWIGAIFVPMLNVALKYVIAFVKAVGRIAKSIAEAFNFEMPEITPPEEGLSKTAGGLDSLADSAANAKKQMNYLIGGFDELNILDKNSGSGIGDNLDVGSVLGDIELPDYDPFSRYIGETTNELSNKMEQALKDLLPWVAAVGAAFAAWKIAQSVLTFFELIKGFKGFSFGLASLGGLKLFADLDKFAGYFEDFMKNGPTFENVAGMISTFAGLLGDAFLILGNVKMAGALTVVQGIGEIVIAVKDISENGINWDNANTAISGLTNVAIGIGLFTKNLKVAGWAVAIQGFTVVITELGKNWDAIKQGDWSGVDKVTLIINGLLALRGLAFALDGFSKIKGLTGAGKATEKIGKVSETVEVLDTAVSSKMSPKLGSLAKNLGGGLIVIAEVALAALLITGAIAKLGEQLEKIGNAWEPVLNNGETIAEGIVVGTGLLVGIGLASYALGTVTLASGGTIAFAIGIGAGMLVGLSGAAMAFFKALSETAKELNENLAPTLSDLNEKLPKLTTDMSDFVDFMSEFAGEVVRYTGINAISSLTTTIDTVIGWFTQNPIEKLGKDVNKVAEQATFLNEKLTQANNELSASITLLGDYTKLIEEFDNIKISDSSDGSSEGLLTKLKTIGESIGSGFTAAVETHIKGIMEYVRGGFTESWKTTWESIGGVIEDEFKDAKDTSNTKLTEILTDVDTVFNTSIIEKLKTFREKYTLELDEIKTVSENSADDIKTYFVKAFDDMYLDIKRVSTNIQSCIEGISKSIGEATRSIRDLESSISGVGFIGFGTVGGFAEGGYPKSAQLFYARENGLPEMVGQIGNRTAVANNDQITTAISNAVYNAITSAMSQGGGSQELTLNISVPLDGQDIYKNQQKVALQRGYNFGMGAFAR